MFQPPISPLLEKRVIPLAWWPPSARSRVSACFLSIPIWCLLGGLTGAQTSTPPTLQSVVHALESHDNVEALRLAQELALDNPTDPRPWTLQGIALEGLHRPEE